MLKIPQNLADADHDIFDAGLLNASRKARERLEIAAFREKDNTEARLNTYRSLRVPWWVETKIDTPWSLRDYEKFTLDRLVPALGNVAPSIDTKRDDVRRLLQHVSHKLVYNAMPLHVGYVWPETQQPYTADQVLERTRYDAWRVATTKHMETESDEHPLWMRGKVTTTSEGPRRLLHTTQPQLAAAHALVGPDFNVRQASTGPLADAIREGVPELLSVKNLHIMYLSGSLRQKFRGVFKRQPRPEMRAMQRELQSIIIDMWMQINATSDAKIAALQEEGKPDVLNASAGEIFDAYIDPALASNDPERIREILPLLSYHTLGAISVENTHNIGRAITQWSGVARSVTGLPSRMIDLAFIACRVALADDIAELESLREQV